MSPHGSCQLVKHESIWGKGSTSNQYQKLSRRNTTASCRCGWFQAYPQNLLDPPRGLVAMVQKNKTKVRPVLDHRKLNEWLNAHAANADVRAQKLNDWSQKWHDVDILNLRQAYLQLHINMSLWPFQSVIRKWRNYGLARMGFGLNAVSAIMKAIVGAAPSRNESNGQHHHILMIFTFTRAWLLQIARKITWLSWTLQVSEEVTWRHSCFGSAYWELNNSLN